MSNLIKYGILAQYHDCEWEINLGKATYEEVGKNMSLVEAMDEVAKHGWEVITMYIEEGRLKCVIRHNNFE